MPIGLIESSWGGTSVETWMPDEAIEDCGLNKLPDYVGCSFLWVLQSFQGQGIQNEESQCWHAMMAPLTKLTIRYSYLLSMHSLLKGEPYGIKEKPMYGMRTGIYTDVPSLLWSTHGERYGAQGITYDNQASELHFDFKDWWSHKQPVSLWICPAWHKCWAKNRQ